MSEINKPTGLKPETTMIPQDFDFNFNTVKDVSGIFAHCESVSPPIRRNADGQQNLIGLRRELAASKNMIHRQGGNWIAQQWSESHGAFIETPMHPSCGERQAIQKCLFGNYETADEAAIHAGR